MDNNRGMQQLGGGGRGEEPDTSTDIKTSERFAETIGRWKFNFPTSWSRRYVDTYFRTGPRTGSTFNNRPMSGEISRTLCSIVFRVCVFFFFFFFFSFLFVANTGRNKIAAIINDAEINFPRLYTTLYTSYYAYCVYNVV